MSQLFWQFSAGAWADLHSVLCTSSGSPDEPGRGTARWREGERRRGRRAGLACVLYEGLSIRGCGCSLASVETGGLVCLRCLIVFGQSALGGRGFPCCWEWRTGVKGGTGGPGGADAPGDEGALVRARGKSQRVAPVQARGEESILRSPRASKRGGYENGMRSPRASARGGSDFAQPSRKREGRIRE
jgi:hypothetical protein